jgi:putative exosortase-associated protein (TIGR04073 family)
MGGAARQARRAGAGGRPRRRAAALMLAMACATTLLAGPAWSQNAPPPPREQDQVDALLGKYNLHGAFTKGGRGLSNFFGGWLEIPLSIHQHYSPSDTAGSWFTGLGYGVFKGIVRTAVGAYEAVTFFLPYPENFVPILPTLDYYKKIKRDPQLPFE